MCVPGKEIVSHTIVLGPSTTQHFRNVSYALNFQEGDELVISAIDHEANIAPWLELAERQKLVLKWWKPNPTAAPDAGTNPKLLASDLPALLSNRTRLVTCTHASNVLGTIHDIKAIASTVHQHSPNALVCVDAVAYAPHRKVDVKDLGVDLYSFSWYKVSSIPLPFIIPTLSFALSLLSSGASPPSKSENKTGLWPPSLHPLHEPARPLSPPLACSLLQPPCYGREQAGPRRGQLRASPRPARCHRLLLLPFFPLQRF